MDKMITVPFVQSGSLERLISKKSQYLLVSWNVDLEEHTRAVGAKHHAVVKIIYKFWEIKHENAFRERV